MVLISTYTFLVSKTLISNLCNLRLTGSLRCSRNVIYYYLFTTASLNGGWVPGVSRDFYFWQPATTPPYSLTEE